MVGLSDSGFAYKQETQANRAAVDEVKLTVKCTALQTSIDSLRREIYELERAIEDDGPNARDADRRRLVDVNGDLADKRQTYNELRCSTILDS